MITFSLQSGSNGNSIYVEAGDVRLLFDAGISGKQAEGRMRVHGRDIRDVDALIISHEHSDHICCAGVFQRKFGLPIYVTKKTLRHTYCDLGPLRDVRHFQAGQPLQFDGVLVHTIPTPHDASDGTAFVVEHAGRRLGILTDLGHPFRQLRDVLGTVHAAYLESNYDPDLLASGSYPRELQDRIRSQHGHLSNQEAADLLGQAETTFEWVALAHLSGENNDPELAIQTHRKQLGRRFPLRLAWRYEVSEVMTL